MGLVVSIILLISLAVALPWMFRSILWNKAMKLLKNGKDQEAAEIFASKKFESMFGKFASQWNLLKLALAHSNNEEIKTALSRIFAMNFSRDQRVTAAKATYFYFLNLEDREMCSRLLDVIRESNDKDEVKQNEMLYRVLIEKKSEDIDFVKNMIETSNYDEASQQLGLLQYILGLQYMYQKNKEEGMKYLKKAKQNLKNTPYSKKIKELVN